MRYKRTILWIIPIGVIGIFFYFYGPQKDVTDNQYITYVKEQPLVANASPIDEVLTGYCSGGKWVYFQTTKLQNVVEFKGECPVNGDVQPVNLQVIVEKDQTSHRIGALLINHVSQTTEEKDVFLSSLYAQ